MRLLTISLIGACCTLVSGQVQAAAFMMRENSAEAVATVFSGDASRADTAATVFSNPAGMSRLEGTALEAGASVLKPQVKFNGSATLQGAVVPGDNSGDAGQTIVVPHFFGSLPLSERVRVGLAVTEPFVNTVDYNAAWSGRYVDVKSLVRTADINPNFSFSITDYLAVGGGVSLQYLKLELSSLIPQFPIFGPGTPDGGYAVNATNWDWGYNLGLLAELGNGWRLGLTYRSAVAHALKGSLDFTPATRIGLISAPASVPIDLPASITLGLTRELAQITFSGEAQLVQWHSLERVALAAPPNPPFNFEERYRDSWMLSAGATYQLDPIWNLKAGVGFDQSPVVDAYRDTGVPDKGRTMLGVGAGARLSDTINLDVGYAYYFSSAASMNSSVNAVDPITGIVLHGGYDNSQHSLTATLSARL